MASKALADIIGHLCLCPSPLVVMNYKDAKKFGPASSLPHLSSALSASLPVAMLSAVCILSIDLLLNTY